ncbi:hypothetical protein ACJMK2_042772 [Sinanodonta woodiana]|uniref:Uncharacterized protein n=1 Tax=Sinanodonta woodiana TaxID=1069815 RepID=A0ABD3VVJ6_SINWO
MPHSLRVGSQGKYCLTLRNLDHENPAGYNCHVSLQFLASERSIREHIYAFNSTESDWSECVNFDAPNNGDQYTASITVHIDGKKLFSHEEKIVVWTARNITLIQTDKPWYKPGQTVKFRILRMDYRLLPLTDLFELITIDNPGGVRVMQWKNVDASAGLVSLEMKLSDDPILGTWSIKVHGADETIQSFKVEEYGKSVSGYTYGQPVKGSLTMRVCFGPEYYPSYYREQPCVDIIETNFDGCHFFSILPSQLKLGKQGYPTEGSLKINATVRETATGIELNGTSTGPPLTYDPLKIDITDESDGYFKPGFPYKGKVTVTLPDGNPASNEVIRIKAEKSSVQYFWKRKFTTDSSGIINFSLSNLGRDVYSLSLSATAVNYEKQTEMGSGLRVSTPNSYRTITQWFSPSLSYIYIPTIKDKVPCDSTVDLDVLYSTDGSSFNVFNFVMQSGDDVIHMVRKKVVFDGADTLMDILKLNPDEELKYHDKELTEGYDPVILNRIGHFKMPVPINSSGSEVKVLVYYIRQDKEVVATSLNIPVERCFKNKVKMEFASTKVRPGEETMFRLQASPNSLCSVGMVDKSVNLMGGDHQLTPARVETVSTKRYHHYHRYLPGSPKTKDSIEAFRSLKMLVVTDAVLETRPCSQPEPYVPIFLTSAKRYPVSGSVSKKRKSSRITAHHPEIKMETNSVEKVQVQTVVRSYFPETWLWDLHTIGDDGVVNVTTEIPHTITEWVGNSLCSNSKDGVGVSPMIGITVFQPFFLSFTLPYSAIRGENLPVLVTVFNYMTECLTMEVRMKETKDFRIQSVSGAILKMCVCGGESKSAKFHIVPLKVGEIDLEATAVSIEDDTITCENQIISKDGIGVQDGVRRKLLVEPEGIPQEYTKSFYLCSEGDIMGPTLSNLKDLLKMPYGCGEQNMASWSPNIYVLQYLTNTNQLTDAIQEEAKGYMRVGYQRQLKYRHHDGSYSAWGDNEYQNSTGSTWLTAFVVKSMAQSRPFIDIDSKDLNFSMQWLLKHQNRDGCIQNVGKVFSSYLTGGLADGENVGGLTAFTLIALIEAGIDRNDPAVVNGFICLSKQQINADTYTLTVMAYAYTLYDVNSPKRGQIMAELESRTRVPNPGQKHWIRDEEEKKEKDSTDFYWRAPSAEVEMTAYVLMAYIAGGQEGALSTAQPVVQWLTKQRNAQGGFSSTQDTVVALQALSMYATLVYQGGLDISVRVDTPSKSYQTGINDSNSLVLTTWDLSPQTTKVIVQVHGKGCAMIQANMKYNIYKDEENETGQASFEVKVNVYRSRIDIDNCKKRTLRICVRQVTWMGSRYALPNFSNMAIVEVKMVTGWIPIKSTVKELLAAKQIQKYEINPDNVDFYFDEFDSQERCIAFEVEQTDIVVSDPKPALIKVYDYYETKDSVMILYDIKTTCKPKEELPFSKLLEPYKPLIDDLMQSQLPTGISKESGLAPSSAMTCPNCTNVIEANSTDFKKILCQAEAVYKASVGRKGKYPIKIHSNIKRGKKVLNSFVKPVMNSDCQCSLLNEKDQTAFILTSPSLLDTEAKELTLDARSTLISWSNSMEKSIDTLMKRSSTCENLIS